MSPAIGMRPWEIARQAQRDSCERKRNEILTGAIRSWKHLTDAERAEVAPLLAGDPASASGNDALLSFVLANHPSIPRFAA